MEEQTKRKVVKAVLVFSALVVCMISIYTTYVIFMASSRPALSPEDYVNVVNDTGNETNSSDGDSFVVDGNVGGDGFVEGGESGENFKTKTIPDGGETSSYNGLINPLVIYEEVKLGDPRRGRIFLVFSLFEIIVIYFIYRGIERGFSKSKN
ncbi:MAG: hypothetical protein KC506_01820 [Nanoarchaeota archaeon]|nr:hypothetical protein [Nanoarchaeota archaeon]